MKNLKFVFLSKVKWLILFITLIIPFTLEAQDHNQGALSFQVEGNVISESNSKKSDLYTVKSESNSLDNKSAQSEKPVPVDIASEAISAEKPVPADIASEAISAEKPVPADIASEAISAEKPVPVDIASEAISAEKPVPVDIASEAISAEKPVPVDIASEAISAEKPVSADIASEAISAEKPVSADIASNEDSSHAFLEELTLKDGSSNFLNNVKLILPDIELSSNIEDSLKKLNKIYQDNLKNFVLNKKDVHDIFMPIEDIIAATVGNEPQEEDAIIEDGTPLELKPRIQQIDLNQLKLIAIIISDSKNGISKALLEDTAGMGFIVEKNTLVGNKNGYVKEILPNKIVIEEPIKFRSGKTQLRITEKKLYISDHEDPINLRHTDQ